MNRTICALVTMMVSLIAINAAIGYEFAGLPGRMPQNVDEAQVATR